MITGKAEELANIVKTHVCPDHPDNVLTVVWHQIDRCYVIRCGDHYPEEIKAIQTYTELHKQGVELPEPIKSNVDKRLSRQIVPVITEADAVTMGGVPAADLGTGELIPLDKLKALVKWATVRGLRPELGHVVMMYGHPYPTIDGYLYDFHRRHKEVSLTSRPLRSDERGDAMIPNGAHAWQSTATVGEERSAFTGIGIVTLEEMTATSTKRPGQLRSPVVSAHPWQMAQKRADWQALRRASPLGTEVDNGEN